MKKYLLGMTAFICVLNPLWAQKPNIQEQAYISDLYADKEHALRTDICAQSGLGSYVGGDERSTTCSKGIVGGIQKNAQYIDLMKEQNNAMFGKYTPKVSNKVKRKFSMPSNQSAFADFDDEFKQEKRPNVTQQVSQQRSVARSHQQEKSAQTNEQKEHSVAQQKHHGPNSYIESQIDKTLPTWAQKLEREALTFCANKGFKNYSNSSKKVANGTKEEAYSCYGEMSEKEKKQFADGYVAQSSEKPKKEKNMYEMLLDQNKNNCMNHAGAIKKMPDTAKRSKFCSSFAKKQTDKAVISSCMDDPELALEIDDDNARLRYCTQQITGKTAGAGEDECPRESSNAVSITCKDGKHYVQKMDSQLGERPAELFNNSIEVVDSMKTKDEFAAFKAQSQAEFKAFQSLDQ